MTPCLAYRQFHGQTNAAAAALVVLAEFGVAELVPDLPRQELTLHGLLQRGPFDAARGIVLANALRYLSACGLQFVVLHDPARTAALENHYRRWIPGFEFRLFQDLKSPGCAWDSLDAVFDDDARVLLVEARHSIREFRSHVLVVRRAGHLHVMNSETGRDHVCPRGSLAAHLSSPVGAGAVSFAGSQYLYTGVAVRIWK